MATTTENGGEARPSRAAMVAACVMFALGIGIGLAVCIPIIEGLGRQPQAQPVTYEAPALRGAVR